MCIDLIYIIYIYTAYFRLIPESLGARPHPDACYPPNSFCYIVLKLINYGCANNISREPNV